MQDLTNKMTWDGSYLEKYHFERMLRKIQRKYKRYTTYKNAEIRCAAYIYEPCQNTFMEALKLENFVLICMPSS